MNNLNSFRKSSDNIHTVMESCLSNKLSADGTSHRGSHRIYHKKDWLFKAEDYFEGVYVLRSGSAKSFTSTINGDEHITQFLYPGDLLGMDGFERHQHSQNIRFLETSSVYFIQESEINGLLKSSDDFRQSLLQSMSHSLAVGHSMMMCLNMCTSEQRLARFIMELSARFSERGLSGTDFILSMTRTDIANYLGMAIETVSRLFASFQQRKMIHIKQRHMSILDFEALNKMVSEDVCSCVSVPKPYAKTLNKMAS